MNMIKPNVIQERLRVLLFSEDKQKYFCKYHNKIEAHDENNISTFLHTMCHCQIRYFGQKPYSTIPLLS